MMSASDRPNDQFIDLFGGAIRFNRGAINLNGVDLYDEIIAREEEKRVRMKALQAAALLMQATEVAKADLETKLKTLAQEQKLAYLLVRVEAAAQSALLVDNELSKQFEQDSCEAFLLSIDIRKSHDLMAKAIEPKEFARFIHTLCSRLSETIKQHHGVFDKFTGDGILAFFPKFYSGPDAAMLAVQAAAQCHAVFHEEYEKHKDGFSTVHADAGLGIGIDYGAVTLVRDFGGLTVVGMPVVYACRLSGAPAGMTLLNRQAYRLVVADYGAYCSFEEEKIEIKHEGNIVGYRPIMREKQFTPEKPDWLKRVEGANT